MESLSSKILLHVVTPKKQLVQEQVDEVVMPGALGYLGILPGHRPLLSTLGLGTIIYRAGNKKYTLAVFGGYAEVLPERVLIFADEGARPEDIDIEKVKEEKKEIEEELEKVKKGESSPEEVEEILLRLRKALLLLEVAQENS